MNRILEARCSRCREVCNPHGTEPDDLIHFAREDGEECGGRLELLGEWVSGEGHQPLEHPGELDGTALLPSDVGAKPDTDYCEGCEGVAELNEKGYCERCARAAAKNDHGEAWEALPTRIAPVVDEGDVGLELVLNHNVGVPFLELSLDGHRVQLTWDACMRIREGLEALVP